MLRKNFPSRRDQRRVEALVRAATFAKLTEDERRALLLTRTGASVRERARKGYGAV